MMIPVRCITCGKPIAQLWESYKERTAAGEDAKQVLDDLGVKRYCCRSIFLTTVDLVPQIAKFKK